MGLRRTGMGCKPRRRGRSQGCHLWILAEMWGGAPARTPQDFLPHNFSPLYPSLFYPISHNWYPLTSSSSSSITPSRAPRASTHVRATPKGLGEGGQGFPPLPLNLFLVWRQEGNEMLKPQLLGHPSRALFQVWEYSFPPKPSGWLLGPSLPGTFTTPDLTHGFPGLLGLSSPAPTLQPPWDIQPSSTFHQRVIGELFGVRDIPPTLAFQLQEHGYRTLNLHLVIRWCAEHNGILGEEGHH